MNTALTGVLVIAGWTPMLARLRAARPVTAPAKDRLLLAVTWILCIVLTATSAWDTTHPAPVPGGWIGAGITLQWAAMGLWSWARATMGPLFAPTGPAPDLVVRGPYRHLRHPMYVATTLATLGLAMAGGRPRDFGWWGVLGLVIAVRAAREEFLLQRQFGARWEAYARRSLGLLAPYPIRCSGP